MGNSVRRNGPGALWFGFLPFLLEAFPYDMSELGTYSQLRDLHSEAIKPGNRCDPWLRACVGHGCAVQGKVGSRAPESADLFFPDYLAWLYAAGSTALSRACQRMHGMHQ
jgi:hypothetical protein